jgi:hypothetical protein
MMMIAIQSAILPTDFTSGLELLTNAAEITIAEIVIDEARHEVMIPMRRWSYERGRFLFVNYFKELSPEPIASTLVIRDTASCELKNHHDRPEFCLMFGVKIENREVYLCSAEEDHGVPCFEMTIRVLSYDIELCDEDK